MQVQKLDAELFYAAKEERRACLQIAETEAGKAENGPGESWAFQFVAKEIKKRDE